MRYHGKSNISTPRGMTMDSFALNALSPVDGRYAATSEPLRAYFSEAALIRERIRIEALWFCQLTDPRLALVRVPLPPAATERLRQLAEDPGKAAASAVKSIEQR